MWQILFQNDPFVMVMVYIFKGLRSQSLHIISKIEISIRENDNIFDSNFLWFLDLNKNNFYLLALSILHINIGVFTT